MILFKIESQRKLWLESRFLNNPYFLCYSESLTSWKRGRIWLQRHEEVIVTRKLMGMNCMMILIDPQNGRTMLRLHQRTKLTAINAKIYLVKVQNLCEDYSFILTVLIVKNENLLSQKIILMIMRMIM